MDKLEGRTLVQPEGLSARVPCAEQIIEGREEATCPPRVWVPVSPLREAGTTWLPMRSYTLLGGRGKAHSESVCHFAQGTLAMCSLSVPSFILLVVSQSPGLTSPATLCPDKATLCPVGGGTLMRQARPKATKPQML